LERQFTDLLGQLRFDDDVLAWVREALHASHADQYQAAVERLRAEHKRLGDRISAMYIEKLDGTIGGDFYNQMAGDWRKEQLRLQCEIDRHEAAEKSYMKTRASRFANSRKPPKNYSIGRNRVKNGAFSTLFYRTAPAGRQLGRDLPPTI
jgi:hypothetical protein